MAVVLRKNALCLMVTILTILIQVFLMVTTIKKCIVRSNGVVENFALGVDKATFIPLEGKDFMDPQYLSEEVDHSWFTYPDGTKTLHPIDGVTDPKFTGPKSGTKEKWEYLDEDKKYSWIKSPTFKGKTAEVGPLAKIYCCVYKGKTRHNQRPNLG